MRFLPQRKRFSDLTGQEILALAISSEEDDARIYRGYAARLRELAQRLDDKGATE